MEVHPGNLSHVEGITQVYLTAFPKSVRFFFPQPVPTRIRRAISNGFALLLLSGGQVVIALNQTGQVVGYCIYALPSSSSWPKALSWPNLRSTLRLIFSSAILLKPREWWRLAKNKYLFIVKSKLDWKPPTPGGRILSIAVDPRAQGQGVGKKLLKYALAKLKPAPVYLEVRSSNEPAKVLYSQFGFTYYGKTEDSQGLWLKMICSNNGEERQ